MKYPTGNRTISTIVFLVIIAFIFSCNKKSPIEGKILGTWRIKRANVYSVFSFRANGSWTSSNRVEGRFSKIVEKTSIEEVFVEVMNENGCKAVSNTIKITILKEY